MITKMPWREMSLEDIADLRDDWFEKAPNEIATLKRKLEGDFVDFSPGTKEQMELLDIAQGYKGLDLEADKMLNWRKKIRNLYKVQLQLWEGVLLWKLPHNLLEQFNEVSADFLDAAWAYKGYEGFREHGDHTTRQYDYVKIMTTIIPKKEKKTRRGGMKKKKGG